MNNNQVAPPQTVNLIEDEKLAIIYVSSADVGHSPEELRTLLDEVRELRRSAGISGLFLYGAGNILGFIEGPKEDIKKYFPIAINKISHHGVVKVFEGEVPCFFFEGFPAHFKALTAKHQMFDTFNSPEEQEYFDEFLNFRHPITTIIRDFIKNNV